MEINAEERITRQEFQKLVQNGHATSLDPTQALVDSCIYVAPHTGRPEYVSYSVAHARMVTFSDDKRRLGDNQFRKGDLREALSHYELAAATSQEAWDYARMLLCDCDNMPDADRNRLRRYIINLGEDPDTICESVRQEIVSWKPPRGV
jgi:hypothetical protein